MKKSVFAIFLIMTTITIFAQTIPVDPTKIDYLQKSKRQNTIAWTTGIPGISVFTIGLIMYMSDFGDGLPGGDPANYDENKVKTGETLMYIGGGLTLVSIPFAMLAWKNKKIASTYSASFKTETTPVMIKTGFKKVTYPAFTVTIKF